ncbi:hypothetical protein, partial [Pseudophaeobacter sp.]|uniref:glycosyltransferase family 2 protein n=1 Tax=Pseudophaeobacter sp. TaxID=1971739 RepID=UPI003298849B
DTAFENIASRLMFERSCALHTPDRRARYAQACVAYLKRNQITYQPGWDSHISQAWGLEITGVQPLSVIIPFTERSTADLLQVSLQALDRQAAPGREILILCPDVATATAAERIAATHPAARIVRYSGDGIGAACNAGLTAAQGCFVNCLVPGDTLGEMALHDWVDALIQSEADFAAAAFHLGLNGEEYHSSFYQDGPVSLQNGAGSANAFPPETALALDGQISPKLYRRSFVEEAGLQFGTGSLPGWQMALHASLASNRSRYFPIPGGEVNTSSEALAQYHPGRASRNMFQSLDQLTAKLPAKLAAKLPLGWQKRLVARALRQQINQVHAPMRRLKLALLAGAAAWGALRRGLSKNRTPLDPGVGQRLETLLSLEALLRLRS